MTSPTSARQERPAPTALVAAVAAVVGLVAASMLGAARAQPAAPEAGEALEAPPDAGEPQVQAAGAALWDPADERLLFGHEADRARPMASLTKMVTALVLVDDAEVDEVVTASPTAAAVGGATVGLQAGQEIPLPSLVAGLMVESGNDAAVAAAEHVAGSEDAFVDAMTERARELGAPSAEFVNASGLTNDPAHRASPADLARIGAAAMEEPLIARFAGADAAVVEGLPPLANRNELLGRYPGADGIKTGHTAAAGFSLAGSATRDGWRLIAVVLDSPDRGVDATRLLDWGFATFERVEVAAGDRLAVWPRADDGTPLAADGPLGATVPAAAEARVALRLAPHVGGAVPAGAALGRAELRVDGEAVAQVRLTAVDAVDDRDAAEATDDPHGAARVGRGLAAALRGLARAGAADGSVPRQDGSRAQASDD